MTLNEFKDWAVSQGTVSKTDGGFPGECVSLVNQYCSKVLGFTAGAWGNAKDWPSNGGALEHFDRVGSPQPGDIGVSGATATNPYGHIWIYLDNNQVLEQNGRISRRVSVSPMRSGTVLRPKNQGGIMADIVSRDVLRVGHSEIGGWPFDEVHAGKYDALFRSTYPNTSTQDFIMRQWNDGSAFRAKRIAALAFYDKYNAVIGDLSTRPTKAELDAALAKLADESTKVDAANKAAADAQSALQAEMANKTQDTKQLDQAGGALQSLVSFVKNLLTRKG